MCSSAQGFLDCRCCLWEASVLAEHHDVMLGGLPCTCWPMETQHHSCHMKPLSLTYGSSAYTSYRLYRIGHHVHAVSTYMLHMAVCSASSQQPATQRQNPLGQRCAQPEQPACGADSPGRSGPRRTAGSHPPGFPGTTGAPLRLEPRTAPAQTGPLRGTPATDMQSWMPRLWSWVLAGQGGCRVIRHVSG